MRAKLIYEKFKEDSDPIQDLGIGLKGIFDRLKVDDILRIKKDLPNVGKMKDSYIQIRRIGKSNEHRPHDTYILYLYFENKNELLSFTNKNNQQEVKVTHGGPWYFGFDFFKKYFEKVNLKDLHESLDQRKEAEKNTTYLTDNKNVGLNKKLIKVIKDAQNNDVKICSVNGSYVKATLGFNEFIEGGHHYADSYPGYKKFIPEDEIWIDEVFLQKSEDLKGIILHEYLERNLMKYKKWDYSKAHEYANKKEEKFRKGERES